MLAGACDEVLIFALLSVELTFQMKRELHDLEIPYEQISHCFPPYSQNAP